MKTIHKWVCLAGLFSALLSVAGCSPGNGKIKDANILLITIDTLRADHLGCYGYDKIETPNIDALARSGILFRNTSAQAPITLPSHASILTGVYPQYHGIRNNGDFFLPESQTTLAELLEKEGYATSAVVSSFILDRQFGLNQGFSHYDDKFPKPEEGEEKQLGWDLQRKAEETTDRAVRWLERTGKSKFFMWVHYMDPHDDYTPPYPYNEKYASRLYDGEIAYTDEHIGRVFDKLKELKLDRNTVIILTSDHGEGLGDHGEKTHTNFIYESTMHIPLIIACPGHLPRKRVILDVVRSIDIPATVLDLVGLPPKEDSQGESLVSLIYGREKGALRESYGETMFNKLLFNWSALRSLKRGDWKYIHAPIPELYNLRSDPYELFNVYEDNRKLAEEMKTRLKEILDTTSRGAVEKASRSMNREAMEKLRSLGYLSADDAGKRKASMEEFEPSGRDPKEMREILLQVNLVGGFLKNNHLNEATALLKKVLAKEPSVLWAREFLGMSLFRQGKVDETISVLESLLKEKADSTTGHEYLSRAYLKKGDMDRAIAHQKKVVQLLGHKVGQYLVLATLYRKANLPDKAEATLLRAAQVQPDDPRVHELLGKLYQEQGKHEKAYEAYQKALEADPDSWDAVFMVAQYQLMKGESEKAVETGLRGIEIRPEAAESYFKMALLCEQTGQIDEALSMLNKAVGLQPDSALLHTMLGNAYKNQSHLQDAKKEFETALKLDPSLRDARLGLAEIFFHEGRMAEAAKEAKRVLDKNPEVFMSHLLLGNIYLKAKNYGRASLEFETVIQMAPDSPMGYYDAACLESIRGNKEQSFAYLEKALRYGGEIYKMHAAQDRDLENISGDPRFQKMLN